MWLVDLPLYTAKDIVKDRKLEGDMMDDFPAVNNITVRGYLPADIVPAPRKLNSTFLFIMNVFYYRSISYYS